MLVLTFCVSFHLNPLHSTHSPPYHLVSLHHSHLLSASHSQLQASALSNHPRALIHWEALPYPSLPYIMPWSCVFLVVSFVWWSAVTNQSWNFKLQNKSVCFSCCNRSPQGHSWGLSTVCKEDFLVELSNKKNLRLYGQRWLKINSLKGGPALTHHHKHQQVTIRRTVLGHVLSRHFFFLPNLRGRAEKNKMPKEKKHWLSVPDYLSDKWHTELIVLSAVILLFILLPNNDRVKQLPGATKAWLFLVLDLSSRAKNVLESSTETFINIANAFVLPRSVVRWEARPRFRFQTKHISWCVCQSKTSLLSAISTFDDFNRKDLGFVFVKARPHYYQQYLRSMISTERILAFGFQ